MTRLTVAGVWRWVVGASVACGLVLSGCSPGGGSSEGTSPSGSGGVAAPSGSASMSGGYAVDAQGRPVQPVRSWAALTRDPVMDEESPEGVVAFGRYFVAVAERAWNTGDTTELEAISTTECSYCTNLVALIQERYSDGRWADNLRYQVLTTEAPVKFPQQDVKYVVFLHVSTGSGTYSTGKSVESTLSARERLELHVCRDSDHWTACGAIGTKDDS